MKEETKRKISATKKGVKQTPQHIANSVAARAANKAATVRVSRRDAALLEAIEQAEATIEEAIAFFEARSGK
ncbi:hypothetical protein [Rhizobium sp.]|uniref:hypothetical protein n=1 Tax=Rhizobium sp. TaxID=391 RepID=UPI0034C67AC6